MALNQLLVTNNKNYGSNIMHNSIPNFDGFVTVLIKANENSSSVYMCQKNNKQKN